MQSSVSSDPPSSQGHAGLVVSNCTLSPLAHTHVIQLLAGQSAGLLPTHCSVDYNLSEDVSMRLAKSLTKNTGL